MKYQVIDSSWSSAQMASGTRSEKTQKLRPWRALTQLLPPLASYEQNTDSDQHQSSLSTPSRRQRNHGSIPLSPDKSRAETAANPNQPSTCPRQPHQLPTKSRRGMWKAPALVLVGRSDPGAGAAPELLQSSAPLDSLRASHALLPSLSSSISSLLACY